MARRAAYFTNDSLLAWVKPCVWGTNQQHAATVRRAHAPMGGPRLYGHATARQPPGAPIMCAQSPFSPGRIPALHRL